MSKEQGPSEERFIKGCLIDPFGEKLAGENYCGNHTQNLWHKKKLSRRLFDWSSWRETSWTIKVTQKHQENWFEICVLEGRSSWRRAGSQGSTEATGKESSRAPKLLLAITFDWSLGGRFRASFGLSRLASFGLAVLEVGWARVPSSGTKQIHQTAAAHRTAGPGTTHHCQASKIVTYLLIC